MQQLAVSGGPPIRQGRPWPDWPQFDADTERALVDALRERRWAVSWPSRGLPSLERRFASAFAEYTGARHAVGVDHGSSALVAALEALDVGPGDEVIVPVLTWVATASAVLRVGAIPVLADVDPASGCLDAAAVDALVSARTRAVIVVHLGSTVADLDRLRAVADARQVALIEDCAQAHGATWRDRQVGTVGELGTFSFQAGKVLAASEGGAVITSDDRLFERVQQLRADSRSYDGDPVRGEMELVERGDVTGANYCMSEILAGLALDQLGRLDAQHRHRESQAGLLEAAMAASHLDLRPVPVPEACGRRSIYEYGVRFGPGTFGDASADDVAAALSAELERAVYPPDVPLDRNVLFRPASKRRFATAWDAFAASLVGRGFPNAEAFRSSTLLLHHSALLGDEDGTLDILRAVEKVAAAFARSTEGSAA